MSRHPRPSPPTAALVRKEDAPPAVGVGNDPRPPHALAFGGGRAYQINPGDRPAVVALRHIPGKPGPIAFVPSVQAAADLGVHVVAVERTEDGLVAAVAALGLRPAVLSPGDILGFIL